MRLSISVTILKLRELPHREAWSQSRGILPMALDIWGLMPGLCLRCPGILNLLHTVGRDIDASLTKAFQKLMFKNIATDREQLKGTKQVSSLHL